MKYLKKFGDYDFKTYILLKANLTGFIIIKSKEIFFGKFGRADDQASLHMKKVYNINNNGVIKKEVKDFYFSWEVEKIKDNMLYQSDDLDDILNNLDMVLQVNKFNM